MGVICLYLFANTMGYIKLRELMKATLMWPIFIVLQIYYYSIVDTVLWARQEAVWILAEASDFSALQNIQDQLGRLVSHISKE